MQDISCSNTHALADVGCLHPSSRPCCALADCFFLSNGTNLYIHSSNLGIQAVKLPSISECHDSLHRDMTSGSTEEKWSVRVMAVCDSNVLNECIIALASGPLVRIFLVQRCTPTAPLSVADVIEPNGEEVMALTWNQQMGHKILASASKACVMLRVLREGHDSIKAADDNNDVLIITPPKFCSISSIHLAWRLSPHSSHGAALIIAWGECIQILQWNSFGEGDLLSSYSRADLSVGLSGPLCALTSGPGGSFLFTIDLPLNISRDMDGEVISASDSLVTNGLGPEGLGPGKGGQDPREDGPLDLIGRLGCRLKETSISSTTAGVTRDPANESGMGILDSLINGSALRDQENGSLEEQQFLPNLYTDSRAIPKAFMLPKVPSQREPQLCLIEPQGKISVGELQRSCAGLSSLTRPDLLHCCRDFVVVSSSSGSALVQIFRASNCLATGSPLLSHITSLSLRTPLLSSAECRLRGIALTLSEKGAGLQLTAFLGRYRTNGPPSFTLLTKSGVGTTKLSSLMCCTYNIQHVLSEEEKVVEALSTDTNKAAALSAGACGSSEGEKRIEAMLRNMESHLEKRLDRIEGLLNTALQQMKMLELRQGD